jgi:putative flippase GtrA
MAEPSTLKKLLHKARNWWAAKSLAIGAGATVIDVAIGTALVTWAGFGTRAAAMTGLAVGTTANFLAHRYIAFREKNAKLASPALRWAAMTVVQTLVHGQVVVMLRDWWGVPFVASKVVADVMVFSVAQLVMVRYLIFPKGKVVATPELSAPTPAPPAEPQSPTSAPSASAP